MERLRGNEARAEALTENCPPGKNNAEYFPSDLPRMCAKPSLDLYTASIHIPPASPSCMPLGLLGHCPSVSLPGKWT